jgi:hypothetical protein
MESRFSMKHTSISCIYNCSENIVFSGQTSVCQLDKSKLFKKPLTDRKWDDPGEVTLVTLIMKGPHASVFISFTFLLAVLCMAQKKEINKRSDLPVIYFSMPMRQNETAGAIDTLMQKMAAAEASHLDSLEKNYLLGDPRLAFSIGFEKECCRFIAHNWRELEVPDSIMTASSYLPAFYRKLATVEYNSDAKTSPTSPVDLENLPFADC